MAFPASDRGESHGCYLVIEGAQATYASSRTDISEKPAPWSSVTMAMRP